MAVCTSRFHPDDELRILLLGEGNVSFTYALVKKIVKSSLFGRYPSSTEQQGSTAATSVEAASTEHDEATHEAAAGATPQKRCLCSVWATTFDSPSELVSKYPESEPFLRYFQEKTRVRVRYSGDVNATDLLRTLPLPASGHREPLQLIYFNNPHIGIEDQYRHRALLSHSFHAIRELNKETVAISTTRPQQVVIALCDEQPLRWDLFGSAARNGFVCVAAVPVLATEFPQFTNRRHQSDAAFPFETMVQYYFVACADLISDTGAWLSDLYAVFGEYETAMTAATAMPNGTLSLKSWRAHVRKSHLLSNQRAHAEADVVKPSELESANAASPLSSTVGAVHASWRGLLGVPLLHPRCAFYHSDSDGCSGGTGYSPYVDLASLPARYRDQLADEMTAQASVSSSLKDLPAQLDERTLGRPLTQREQVKLKRYLAKREAESGPVTTKATTTTTSPSVSTPDAAESSIRCVLCQPPRPFASQHALNAHNRSQHVGIDQLHPNHHARVHRQIIADDNDVDVVDDDGKDGNGAATSASSPRRDFEKETHAADGAFAYCAVCGLRFTDAAAYDEHLAFLSPSAVQDEAVASAAAAASHVVTKDGLWCCEECVPVRTFHDERALLQHRTLKHTDTISAAAPAQPSLA